MLSKLRKLLSKLLSKLHKTYENIRRGSGPGGTSLPTLTPA